MEVYYIINNNLKKHILVLTLTVVFALVVCGTASADIYIGGQKLTTVESGTVSGGVYSDSYYGFNGTAAAGSTNDIKNGNVNYNFKPLPSNAEVVSAKLYTNVYLGNMIDDYPVNVDITFNGKQIDHQYLSSTFMYVVDGGSGITYVNDHTIRVTSDYFMWYDVTDQIKQNNQVHVDTTNSVFDGRIRIITLIVVYNDGDSDKIMYWINQGQDVSSYRDEPYIGTTTYTGNPPKGSVIENATLRTIYIASKDGLYTFNDTSLLNGTQQGSYSGCNTWDVTNLYKASDINTLTYDKNNGVGLIGYYKIAFAILTTQYQINKPDLQPIEITIKDYPFNYSLVKVKVTNNGVKSRYFDVTLYDNGTQIRQQQTYALGTEQNRTLSFLCKLSNQIDHKLQVVVDKNNKVAESDETNNTLTQTLYNNMDLQVSIVDAIYFPQYNWGFATAKVTSTRSNITDTFDVTLYDNNILMEQKTINGLTSDTKLVVFWWIGKEKGKHNIEIVVDKNNTIIETNENNNSIKQEVKGYGC